MIGDLLNVRALGDRSRRTELENAIRARSRSLGLPENEVLCRVLGKYKFYVNARDVGFGAHVVLDGYWEFWITQFVIRHLSPGTTVIDIGANHGYYAIVMCDLVGPDGMVLCIEPSPLNRKFLERNLAINGFQNRATVETRAVGDVSGHRVTFTSPDREPKNARVLWEAEHARPQALSENMIEVETLALDDLPLTGVDLIKVDIEGAEERMWRGMQRFLDRNMDARMLLEFNPARCSEPGRMLAEIAQRFPLRHLDTSSQVADVSADEILSARPDDWMLYLSRRDPIPEVQPDQAGSAPTPGAAVQPIETSKSN